MNLKYDEYISLVDQIQRMNESLPSQAVLQSKIQKIDTMTEEEWRPILESLKRSVK